MPTSREGPVGPAEQELELLAARLDRARVHYENFGQLWASYLDQKPHSLQFVAEPDGTTSVRLSRLRPIPAELSVILGEFLYEMRAALDNCLYAAAVIVSGQNPPPDAERLEWPIREDAQQWRKQAKRYTSMPKGIVDALEAIQPYQAECPPWNSLAILHDLARFDRHRAPRVLALYLVSVRMKAATDVIDVLDLGAEGVVRDGDQLVRIRVAPGCTMTPDNFDIDVEFDVDVDDVRLVAGPDGSTGRPWGSLSRRLGSVHRAVSEYCEGIIQIAVDVAKDRCG